jgi:SAM-dependent methyltransferase
MEQTATLKWQLMAQLMRGPGSVSSGIALGYRAGFDSGEMLDYVYENRPQGRFLVGKLFDWVYLNAVGWRAIRARKTLLQRLLRLEVAAVAGQARPVVLLDVASGPGRYLLELARDLQAGTDLGPGGLQIICRDLDPRGLALGRERAAALGLTNVRYELGDATGARSLATVDPRPQVVVASGVYELFNDTDLIRRSMAGIQAILPPGGRFLFTTQVRHPQLEFIANVLVNRAGRPWVMGCRSLADVEDLARRAGFEVMRSAMEPVGLFGVTICRKPGAASHAAPEPGLDQVFGRQQGRQDPGLRD